MSDELFRTIVAGRPARRGRLGGVPVSLAVHAAILAALFVIPMLSVGPLPMLRERLEIVLSAMTVEPPPPVPVPGPRVAPTAVVPIAVATVPLVQPAGISDETGLHEPPPVAGPPSTDVGVIAGSGLPSVVEGTTLLPAPPPAPTAPVRAGGNIDPPRKVRHVAPVYPSMALAARVEGIVTLDAVIAIDGSVKEVRVLASASPLLNEAAIEAVRQWRFTPTLLNGVPVPVILMVSVEFKLR